MKLKKVRITSSHHGLYKLGYTHATNGMIKRGLLICFLRVMRVKRMADHLKFLKFGFGAAIRPNEAGIASNRR